MFQPSPNQFAPSAPDWGSSNVVVGLAHVQRGLSTTGNSVFHMPHPEDRFSSIRALARGWDGPGSEPILDEVIERAIRALQYAQGVSPSEVTLEVVPCANGSLQLELHDRAHRFEIHFEVDGATEAWWHNRKASTELEAEGDEALKLLARWAVRDEAWPVLSIAS